ncbi:hypothetical protein N3K66_004784 [Trichothecium roseum]|uniref:Uncharacterized protein n=1 Tax=Trichothecium roseum TaxID=47278 RepID=A0ACC0V2S7_9HYPO|nr:hypothetical protein N3K66_004784 [Trichothecium roseum]
MSTDTITASGEAKNTGHSDVATTTTTTTTHTPAIDTPPPNETSSPQPTNDAPAPAVVKTTSSPEPPAPRRGTRLRKKTARLAAALPPSGPDPDLQAALLRSESLAQHERVLRSKVSSQSRELANLRKRLRKKKSPGAGNHHDGDDNLHREINELMEQVKVEKSVSKDALRSLGAAEAKHLRARRQLLALEAAHAKLGGAHGNLEKHALSLEDQVRRNDEEREAGPAHVRRLQLQVDG